MKCTLRRYDTPHCCNSVAKMVQASNKCLCVMSRKKPQSLSKNVGQQLSVCVKGAKILENCLKVGACINVINVLVCFILLHVFCFQKP